MVSKWNWLFDHWKDLEHYWNNTAQLVISEEVRYPKMRTQMRKGHEGIKKSLKIFMNSTYNNNVQTFCNYWVQAHSGACNPISGAQRPPLTLLWLLRIEGNTVTYPKTCQTIVDLFCSVKHSNCVIVFRYFKLFRLLKKLITSSCDQTTRQRIPNLRIFIIQLANWEKKLSWFNT